MWADRVWVRWNLQGSAGVRGPLITGSGPSVVRSNSSPELGPPDQPPISPLLPLSSLSYLIFHGLLDVLLFLFVTTS